MLCSSALLALAEHAEVKRVAELFFSPDVLWKAAQLRGWPSRVAGPFLVSVLTEYLQPWSVLCRPGRDESLW